MTDNEFYTFMANTAVTGMDTDTDSLEHYGIKGQHWGQRRFQNPDGSLTEAGKKRYESYEKRKQEWINNPKKAYKHRKDLSTKELTDAIHKAEAENKLKSELLEEQRVKFEQKMTKQQRKDEIKRQKAEMDLAVKQLESNERVALAQEKTKIELQKVKDRNQDKRTEKALKDKQKKEAQERKKLINRLKSLNDWGKTINTTYDTVREMFKKAGLEKEFEKFFADLINKNKKT